MNNKVQFYTKINLNNGFRGAQLKTWDYYNFINSHDKSEARILFHPKSQWSNDVRWPRNLIESEGGSYTKPDFYLLKGGNDWLLFDQEYKRNERIPVISPIVNYRILNPEHKSHLLLKRRAIWICPNPDLARKVSDYSEINGPVYCISHGLNINKSHIPNFNKRKYDLTIIAIKNQKLGKEIYEIYNQCYKYKVRLIDKYEDQESFLKHFLDSKITLHLPMPIESFYLPGLESLASGSLTIMPNCLGNTFYTTGNKAAFISDYSKSSICDLLDKALSINEHKMKHLSKQSIIQSQKFNLDFERKQWHKLLDDINVQSLI